MSSAVICAANSVLAVAIAVSNEVFTSATDSLPARASSVVTADCNALASVNKPIISVSLLSI